MSDDLETLAKGTKDSEGRIEGAWLDMYLDLKAAGLHWKKAAFVAWYNAPKASRQPTTMKDLSELLNYKSEQVFYKWQHQDWFKDIGIEKSRESIFVRYVADVDRATIAAALTETGSPGVQARKLFYEQLSPPVVRVEQSGPDGGPIETRQSEHDSDDRIAEILSILSEAGAIEAAETDDADDAETNEVRPSQADS